MVTSKRVMERIRKIIENKYAQLVISIAGKDAYSNEELKRLKNAGVDTSNEQSLLALAYYHNFLNRPGEAGSPTSVEDIKAQISRPRVKPEGEAHDYAVEHINANVRDLVERLSGEANARLLNVITQNNEAYRRNALQNLDRPEEADRLVKESTLSELKTRLRDTTGDINRDWKRIAITETSNIIGVGSVDRIVADNTEKDLEDIYCYRITVKDAATCKWCKSFYEDSDGAPKVYKLSTLLANGSNYGKPKDAWMPVVGATHPNTRTGPIIELKPGWELKPGGSQSFIGMEKWQDYIVDKLSS